MSTIQTADRVVTRQDELFSLVITNPAVLQVEVTDEVFDYMLNVLPPISMNRSVTMSDGRLQKTSFVFQEGYPPIAFWWTGTGATKRFWCERVVKEI